MAGLSTLGSTVNKSQISSNKVVRWSTVGNTMYGYDSSGRLVATKAAPITALPVVPKATTPTILGGGSTYTPPKIPPTTLGGGSTYNPTTNKAVTSTSGGAKVSTPATSSGGSGNTLMPVAGGAVAPLAPGAVTGGQGGTTFQPNVPMPNPGGYLGRVPNFEAMMGTYQANPQAWLEKVFQLQGLDPLGRNYAMAQAAAPYFAGMQYLAPFMTSLGTGNFNPDNANASAASMLNWVANAAGTPGGAVGMPGAAGIFGNLASGIGNNQSMLYDLLIGQMGVDEQTSVLNDLIASMGMTGSLAGPWAAALQNRLGRLGSEYQLAMGDATASNPLGPLVEYFLRSVGQPNARAAASNLIP